MRVTDNMRLNAATIQQSRVAERLTQITEKASTGLKVSKPSDDPVAFARIAGKDGKLANLMTRNEALTRSQSDLELSENALSSASSILTRVRELAVDMANGDRNATDRVIAAAEVRGLSISLLAVANQKGARGYLFGGTKTDTPPFTSSGSFVGNDGIIHVEIADGVTTAANVSGSKAFTASGGQDIFADISAFATALSSNDTAGIQTALSAIESGFNQIVSARSDAGIAIQRLRSAADVSSNAVVAVRTARSQYAEGDPLQIYSDLTNAKAAYERSLAVTQQILQLTGSTSQ